MDEGEGRARSGSDYAGAVPRSNRNGDNNLFAYGSVPTDSAAVSRRNNTRYNNVRDHPPSTSLPLNAENQLPSLDDLGSARFSLYRRSNSSIVPAPHAATPKRDDGLFCQVATSHENEAFKNERNADGSRSIDSPSESASGDGGDHTEPKRGFLQIFRGFSKKQSQVFVSLIVLSLCDLMGFTAIAPFFPVVAGKKGMSATEIGIVFSSYSVAGIFSAIIVGSVIARVGAKFCVISGMFWSASSLICFGFLLRAEKTAYFVLCVLCRLFMGFGANGAFTAMFAIVFQEFGQNSVTVLSISESMVGVGMMVGPLIGGSLYDAGGYMLPFLVLGGIQGLLTAACWWLLPSVPIEARSASVPPVYLLKSAHACVGVGVVISIFTINSFYTANMPAYLDQQFNFSATMIGVVSLVGSVFYAVTSPIYGYIADTWKNCCMMEIGLFMLGVSMLLYGPASIVKSWFGWTSQHEWMSFFATALCGASFGASLMQTFFLLNTATNELNLPDSELAKYGLISGLWNSAFSVGDIAGPALGGVLVEHLGFPDASAVFFIVTTTLVALKLLHRLYMYFRNRRSIIFDLADESSPLLGEGKIV